jgi:hypothetical protein
MLGVLDMFDKLKGWFGKDANVNPRRRLGLFEVPVPPIPPAPPNPRPKSPEKTAKQIANEKGEPYVAVLSMDVDPNNLHQGAFELDWNEIFVARLVKAGYMMKPTDTDGEIVDRWFQNVCRHVVMETWEQEQAIKNSGMYVQKRDLGDGRSEIG